MDLRLRSGIKTEPNHLASKKNRPEGVFLADVGTKVPDVEAVLFLVNAPDLAPAHVITAENDDGEEAAEHDERLKNASPDNRLHPAKSCVNDADDAGADHNTPEIEPSRL